MKRMFYSISEVSELVGVSIPTLRYWEKEFEQLTPRRNEGGTRFYKEEDVELVRTIVYLRDSENLTIEGIRRRLTVGKDDAERKKELVERLQKLRGMVLGVRNQL